MPDTGETGALDASERLRASVHCEGKVTQRLAAIVALSVSPAETNYLRFSWRKRRPEDVQNATR